MLRILHVGINFGAIEKVQSLEGAISQMSEDWIRYAPNNWLLWSSHSIQSCSLILREQLSLNDQFLVFEFGAEVPDGFHYEWVWKWITEKRSLSTRINPYLKS